MALTQVSVFQERLKKFQSNLKKCEIAKRTEGYLQGRLKGIEEIWCGICKVDELIESLKTKSDESLSHFEGDEFGKMEEQYFDIVGQFNEYLKVYKVGNERIFQDQGMGPRSDRSGSNQSKVRLPKIVLPTFSGSYHEWLSFKNRFSNLIQESTVLGDVEKLEYVKSCVVGEAERSIQRFQITDANYQLAAWDRLNEKYDNKRILQDTKVEGIIDRAPLKVE